MKPYRTVAREAEAELVVKKSRFIAAAFPVDSEHAAAAHLAAIRKRYHDARHHCYAYIVGTHEMRMKFSDDGEPQGTAGIVMLDVLKKRGLSQTLAVVTRYFGGVLLGANGLVRAYGGACAAAVEKAGVREMRPADALLITCPYAVYDRLERYLRETGAVVTDSEFTQSVRVRALGDPQRTQVLIAGIQDACDGTADIVVEGQVLAQWPSE
jgi:uncharacterized YigZ family protein